MTTATIPTRVLLLVEDNPGDAQLVADLLEEAGRENYQIVHVPRVSDAIERLQYPSVDVVVLDLRLPDCNGVDSVKRVRETVRDVPIVVLTGSDDEKIALNCISAGAQDYLSKQEVRTRSLKRAIGYAITRRRENQLRELEAAVEHYRRLSSATQVTSVTAALAGSGAIATRSPATFAKIVVEYRALFDSYLTRVTETVDAPRSAKEHVITLVGDCSGGPRDLLDIHVAALDQITAQHSDAGARAIVFESRLLALEMMGLLVDFYRVGYRWRHQDGEGS